MLSILGYWIQCLLSYIAFITWRDSLSIPSLFKVFFLSKRGVKFCQRPFLNQWRLTWFMFSVYLCTRFHLFMLSQSCISGIKSICPYCMIFVYIMGFSLCLYGIPVSVNIYVSVYICVSCAFSLALFFLFPLSYSNWF